MAIAIVPILGMTALAIDVGYLRNEQRLQQSAADSAALAGAAERAYPASAASPAAWITAARTDAASNGFTHDGTSTIVTVNNPPASGSYTASSTAVEVLVKVKHPGFFSGIFNKTSDWVTTRAVAHLTGNGAGCIVGLNPNALPYTIQVTGGSVNASACNIEDAGKWNFTGGTVTAAAIGVAGTITKSGGTYGAASAMSAAAPSDPCQSIAGCAYLSNSPPATTPCSPRSVSSGTVTLLPGIYCGLTISGGIVTLSPGLYVMTTSAFKISGGTVTGTGVTFYIAAGSSVDMTGGTKSLSAPSSGNTAGMLIYQVAANTTTAKLTGGAGAVCPGSTTVMSGIVYTPGALLNVTGGYWDPTAVIAGSLNVSGGGLTCMSSPVGSSQVARAVLVE